MENTKTDEEAQWSEWSDEETVNLSSLTEDDKTGSMFNKNPESQDTEQDVLFTAVPLISIESKAEETFAKHSQESSPNSTDSENIPLSKLKQDKIKKNRKTLRKLPVKRKLITVENDVETDAFSDDSLKDATYKPSKDSASSESDTLTDSEDGGMVSVKRKKRRVCKQITKKNRAWKKTSSKFSAHTKQTCVRKNRNKDLLEKIRKNNKILNKKRRSKKSESIQSVDRAKALSKKLHSIKLHILKLHKRRIDQLLASNELKRVPVSADGNCFFGAVAYSLNDYTTSSIDELRTSICDYMLENIDAYCAFISIDSNNSTQRDEFQKEIEVLRTSGQWNAKIADCLPLATADKFNCTLRIYSSSIATPVVDVKPSYSTANPDKLINIAYLAIKNEEHYEATSHIDMAEINKTKTKTLQTVETNMSASPMDTEIENEGYLNVHDTTPHKRADDQSPRKRISSRKKKRNVNKRKSNIRKTARSAGKHYISKTGKHIKEKGVKQQNCEKCRFKCNKKFTEEERQQIFEVYYSLENYERQRSFICDMILKETPVRKKSGRKNHSLKYFLAVGDKRERVCQTFFLKTLDIGRKTVSYTLKRMTHGTFSGKDMRGRTTPASAISEERLNIVRNHIKAFPRMESHYARKNSTKQYLANDLNIKQMWLLYCEECQKNKAQAVKESKYRQIFCYEFNLSFFKPKKDQCSTCAQYNRHQQAGSLTEEMKQKYGEHQRRKVQAREEKENDKAKAKRDDKYYMYYVATFDLQAVLTTQCSLVSELYYSRKLCCYSLTVYSLRDKQVVCHLWDETQGKRGSCEIATCLMKNTQSICSSAPLEHVTYYSDTCGGQNRNKFVAVSFLYTIAKLPHLKTLNHKFLQSGHIKMECDSVHSTIETTKKKTSTYVPSQWSTLICMARKSNPYVTIPLKYDHVVDFRSFVKKQGLNFQSTTSGLKINWLLVRWIQVRQTAPKKLFVNYSFDESQFLEISVQHAGLRKKGRPVQWPETDSDLDMCYNTKLPISTQKKKDLMNLCTKSIIPDDFHGYFQSLKTSNSTKDKIPISTSDEESDSD